MHCSIFFFQFHTRCNKKKILARAHILRRPFQSRVPRSSLGNGIFPSPPVQKVFPCQSTLTYSVFAYSTKKKVVVEFRSVIDSKRNIHEGKNYILVIYYMTIQANTSNSLEEEFIVIPSPLTCSQSKHGL